MKFAALNQQIQTLLEWNTRLTSIDYTDRESDSNWKNYQAAIADLAKELREHYTQEGKKFLTNLLSHHSSDQLKAVRVLINPTQIDPSDHLPWIIISTNNRTTVTQDTDTTIYYIGSVNLTLCQGTAHVYGRESNVTAKNRCQLYAYGQTYVETQNHPTVYLYNNSRCRASGGTVNAYGHSFVQEQGPTEVNLCDYSGGYFPLGVSNVMAIQLAQLLYCPSGNPTVQTRIELVDQTTLVLDNPKDYPINVIRYPKHNLVLNCQTDRVNPKDYLEYLYQRNRATSATSESYRPTSLKLLKIKVSRYIQAPGFLSRVERPKTEAQLLELMLPYLPQALSQSGMTSEFLRTHFAKDTLLSHNLYAYDDIPYTSGCPQQLDKPVYLFGAQVGHFEAKERFYTYEQAFAYTEGEAKGILNGQSLCVARGRAQVTAKDLSHLYVGDGVKFQLEERAQGGGTGNAVGKIKDYARMNIDGHVTLQMQGQSRCEAKGWTKVKLTEDTTLLADQWVTVEGKGDSLIGVIDNDLEFDDKVKLTERACAIQLRNEAQVALFREKYMDNAKRPQIQEAFSLLAKPKPTKAEHPIRHGIRR